ncbi:MAG: TonB-dependent receptor [Acidobacteria bacterium]|nr:TonB-dependent receptor [Acidobacteriota bacterium]MBI3282240.1 TonB-dependent receptor [Acidobacteriota bacterium]
MLRGFILRGFAAVALCTVLSFAQDFRATILGQVTDPTGAAIPHATVKAVKTGTNETKETTTNAAGIYTLPYLDPGDYTVIASATGFSELRRTGISVRVADKLNLPLKLELGQVAESVTVTGEAELIQTATASRGLVFDPIKVQEYPLNGRQSYMLMMLTPGVMFTQRTFGSSGFSGTRAWDMNGNYTMNGGRTGTNQFLLNGAPVSTTGSWQLAPNVEAIQEFKVMVNTYDAAYGRSGGGHVNTTIKSGTNAVHGSVFDFWRNTILDANNTQNNRQGAGRGKRNQHQFGGAVGLPIRKDKDFLFFSFEGWREIVPFPVVSSAPPAAMRTGDGFTLFGQRIYDPLTSRTCVAGVDAPSCLANGQYIRAPFPENRIPASRIHPVGKRILDLYPLPNQVGRLTLNQNFFATESVGRYRYEQPMVRYDKVISDKDRLYGLFYFQDGSEFRNQNGFDPPARTGNMHSVRTLWGVVVDYTRVISSTTVLDVRGSLTRFWSNFPDVSDYEFTWDKLGIKQIPEVANFQNRLAPRVTVSDYNAILGNQRINWSAQDQLTLSPSLSQTRGRHSTKYGFEWAVIQRPSRSEGRSSGELGFDRVWTRRYSGRAEPGRGNTDGSGIASLLLGLPTSGSIAYNDTFLRRDPYVAWYVQDDWKVSNRLTLNLGLRYDFQFPFTEMHDRTNSGFDFDAKNPLSDQVLARWRQLKTEYDARNPRYPYPEPPAELKGGLLFAGVGGQPRRIYDFDFTTVQPRAGVAWQFMEKTVLRAGFGIFHRFESQTGIATGFSQSTPYQRSLDGDRTPSAGATGPYSLENPWPQGVIAPSGSSLGLLTNVGRGVTFHSRKREIPRTYQYSFGLERELPGQMVLEASYVGSRTYHEPITLQLSEMSWEQRLKFIADTNNLNVPLPNPYYGILPAAGGLGAAPVINARELYRRIPLFPGVSQGLVPWGAVWYNALQIRFEKRAFSNRTAGALTWVLSYTFAKQMERSLINNWNFENEKQISQLTSIDRPQQFSFSGVWDLPFGKGRHFGIDNPLLNALAGGWNYNWILTYYAGPPTGFPDAIFTCGSYVVTDRAPERWFNNDRGCYTDRAPFSRREVESRFPSIRDPAMPQLSMAIAKKFRFTERYTLEARGEAFNATNTPILKGPNTNFRSPDFGRLPIQQDNFPRNIQLGLRLSF